jgi:hypothetical protein
MSTEQKTSEQNALATTLSGFWTNFKQGKIISYKWMAVVLILVAAIGVTWYITSERSAAASRRWVEYDEANSIDALKEVSAKNPGTIQDKLARLQRARALLGESGIEQLNANSTELRDRGVASIEDAREMFQQLLEDFKTDPVFKPECLLALAKAEAALVAVPATPGNQTEYKGKVPKVIEYLDQLSEAAAPDTPWATDSKRLADQLRKNDGDFVRIQRSLFDTRPTFPKFNDPMLPGGLGPNPPLGGPASTGLTGIPGGK